MKGMAITAVLLTFVIYTAPASADGLNTGSNLEYFCTTANLDALDHRSDFRGAMDGGICETFVWGVVVGFVSGIAYQTGYSRSPTKIKATFCLPAASTEEQLARVVTKYLNDHPEQLNENAAWLILNAISAAFPARKGCGFVTSPDS